MVTESLQNLTKNELYYFSYSELSVLGRHFVGGCKTWTTGTFGDLYLQSQLMKVKSLSLMTLEGTTHSLPSQAKRDLVVCNSTSLPDKSTALSDIVGVMSGGSESKLLSVMCGAYEWNVKICDHKKVAMCVNCDDPCFESTDALVYNSCGNMTAKTSNTVVRQLVVAFTPPKPAPKFNATVISYTSTSVSLKIKLEDYGKVACGYFPIGKTLTGAFMIYMQGAAVKFADESTGTSVDITIKGLLASTTYNFYCTTVSTDNIELELQDILHRVVRQKTECCKAMSVSWVYLALSELKYKGGAANAVKVQIDSLPETYVSYSFSLTNDIDNSNFPLIPATLQYFGNSSLAAAQYLSVGSDAMSNAFSNGITNLTLNVKAFGASRNDYALILVEPTVQLLSAVQEPSTPQLLSAAFTSDGTSLLVTFDSDTNLGGIKDSSFGCNKLFVFANADLAICQWTTLQSVTAKLGSGGSVIPGDSFKVKSQNIQAMCTLTDQSLCIKKWKFMGESTKSILFPPGEVVAPTVVISAPLMISKCDRLTIDISGSKNSGGRSWKSNEITVTDVRNETAFDASMKAMTFFKSNFSVSPPMKLPSGVLDVSMYKIVVTLTNFLGGVGSSSSNVLVVSKAVPVVSILGESLRSITRQSQLSLLATASTTQCTADGTIISTSNLEFEWSISSNNIPLSQIVSSTKVKTAYKLPAYTLDAGKLYTIKVSVLYTLGMTASSASIQVYVGQSNLVAAVKGGSSRGMLPNEELELDGSSSYDENLSPYEYPTFLYSWECMTVAPTISFSCGLTLTTSSLGEKVKLSAPADIAEESMYRIRLTISDKTRSSYTDVTVKILDAGQPKVTIVTSFTQRFNPTERLNVQGVVVAVETQPATCAWSAQSGSGNDIDMSTLALTPLSKTIPAAQSGNVMLALSAGSLPERFTAVFTLQCKKAVATLIIETNGPPTSGNFRINPSEGVEFESIFVLSGTQWFDEDLPLAYSFSFGDSRQTIKPAGESSYIESTLPVGEQNNGFKLSCFLVVFDSLSASVEVSGVAVVNKLVLPASELNTKLSSAFDDSMSSTDPNVLISFLSVASSMLNFVDCSSSPKCNALNRYDCKNTANTCGSCLSNYVGISGDSNTPCMDLSRRKLAQLPNKECINNCNGRGVCLFIDSNTNAKVNSCTIIQSSCDATCICDEGYYGNFCSMTAGELEAKQSMRAKLLQGDSKVDLDLDPIAVSTSMISLTSITKQVDEISYDAAKVALDRGLKLLDMGTELRLLPDKVNNLFSSFVDLTVIHPPSVVAKKRLLLKSDDVSKGHIENVNMIASRRSLSSESNVAALQTTASSKFGQIILQSMVSGQENLDTIESVLRFSSGVASTSQNVIGTYVNMSTPLTKGESIEGKKPFSLQLYVTSGNTDGVKLSVGMISESGYGERAKAFISNPMTLLVGDMSVCNSKSGCKVLITMQNNVVMEYKGQDVVIEKQKKYLTRCNGTASTHKYQCTGSTVDIDLDLKVVCDSDWIGNITSTCPYIKSGPSCKMIIPSTLSSAAFTTTSNPCTLKSYTATTTTCECTVSSEFSRRRLSTSGNDFQFTQESQSSKIEIEAQIVKQPDPTANPTFAPSISPAPTANPTFAPNSPAPTANPTFAPSISPAPTANPTFAPSYDVGSPTPQPTIAPTANPTVQPTIAPTASPTKQPTMTPTVKPTSTLRPTPRDTVTIEVSQSIGGLNVDDYDTPEERKTNGRMIVLAVLATLNNQTGLSLVEDDIKIISVASARRLNTYRDLLSASITVNYQVTGYANGLSSSQIISTMTAALSTAASNGVFATNIYNAYVTVSTSGSYTGIQVQAGTVSVNTPSVTVVIVYTPKPTTSPTLSSQSSTQSKDKSLIIAAVVACLGFVTLAFAYYYYLRHKKKKALLHYNETGPEDAAIDILYTVNHVDDREGNNDDSVLLYNENFIDREVDILEHEILRTQGSEDEIVITSDIGIIINSSGDIESTNINTGTDNNEIVDTALHRDEDNVEMNKHDEKRHRVKSTFNSKTEAATLASLKLAQRLALLREAKKSSSIAPAPPADSLISIAHRLTNTPKLKMLVLDPARGSSSIQAASGSPSITSSLAKVKLLSQTKLPSEPTSAVVADVQKLNRARSPPILQSPRIRKNPISPQLQQPSVDVQKSNRGRSPPMSQSPPARMNPSISPQLQQPTSSEKPSAIKLAIEKINRQQARSTSPTVPTQTLALQPSSPTRTLTNSSMSTKQQPIISEEPSAMKMAIQRWNAVKVQAGLPEPQSRINLFVPPTQQHPIINEKPSAITSVIDKINKDRQQARSTSPSLHNNTSISTRKVQLLSLNQSSQVSSQLPPPSSSVSSSDISTWNRANL